MILGIVALALGADDRDGTKTCVLDDLEVDPAILAKTFDEYEKLLLELENGALIEQWPGIKDGGPGSGSLPQLWEGASGVKSREAGGRCNDPVEIDRGKVFTRFADGEGWIESWVVREPEVAMRRSQRLPYLGRESLVTGLDEIRTLPNVASYGLLTFRFQYLCPPSTAAIAGLPTVVPPFVTDVLRFRVYFTEPGFEEMEGGALYRERMDVPAGMAAPEGINWQDTWVLWDNFDLPHPDPLLAAGREVRLEAIPWEGETVRGFLETQMYDLPGRCVVRTRSNVSPVPPP